MAKKNFMDQVVDFETMLNDENNDDNLTDEIAKESDNKHDKDTIFYAEPNEFIPYYNEKLRLDIHTGEEYLRLKESIEKNGIMSPIFVTNYNGQLMIISGHNRCEIAKELSIKVPYILKNNLSQEEMDLICIDSNILNRQLNEMKPSQLAYILKVKFDAESHQGTLSHGVTNLTGENIGEEYGLSRMQIHRYIKLNSLSSYAMQLLDNKDITMRLAYELCFLDEEIQDIILGYRKKFKINEKIIKTIRNDIKEETLESKSEKDNYIKMKLTELCITVLRSHAVDYRNIKQYIPDHIKKEDVEGYVIRALQAYKGE